MITQKKLQIYQEYRGDIDSWVRFANQEEKYSIRNEDWSTIEGLIQDFRLVTRALVTEEYAANVANLALSICDSDLTVQKLKSIAKGTSF